ncbi:hypothetical protein MLD38_009420 [Melastoma candidum]|uniref:Uncharacterized protein n=1 Tax=Melastoma candidum TaxID=119954 RepID=A0ACB9RXG9_9MYRT|nr:hypothetical protein MLD38_009420 [Melastoma candidum]
MAPVAPLPFSLADRDIQAIVDAYKEDTANPKYAFKHLFFSVTDPQFRAKPAGVSDLQDGVILSDAERLKTTQTTETFPSRYTSQNTKDETKGAKSSAMPVQVMRIVEALEGKGCRLPLVKGEAQLADKLAIITKQSSKVLEQNFRRGFRVCLQYHDLKRMVELLVHYTYPDQRK